MKKSNYALVFIYLLLAAPVFAQVQIDKQIQLTGPGSDGSITGIQRLLNSTDAANANYIQRDSLTFAMATGSNNNYAVSLSPAVTGQYSTGMMLQFMANYTNTGVTTLTVNNLGAVTIKKQVNQDLAPADISTGQIVSVIYDGVNFQMLSPVPNAASSSTGVAMQIFNTSTTFTVPQGDTSILIDVWGAGGGGGGLSSNGGAGAGGGGGFGEQSFSVTGGTVLTITIGAGGTKGVASNGNGGPGGTTSVTGTGVSISATGGGGGTGGSNVSNAGGAGGSSTAAWNITGGTGGSGSPNTGYGGTGGACNGLLGGAGGISNTANSPGQVGNVPGGGGSGGEDNNSEQITGAAGAAGQVRITW